MNAAAVKEFLEGRRVYALDPQTRVVVACVDYGAEGQCVVRFLRGDTDTGVYGFEGGTYWTRYEKFRGGKKHSFRLKEQGPGVAQAYFTDGTVAFLQSHSENPADGAAL